MALKPNDSTFAGMLAKMIPLPFGRSRWVSRYFVLLDSELRLYKDPHTETPSQTLNLRKISQVLAVTTTPQRPHCFQLGEEKPWIIDCGSEKVMEDWIFAIRNRMAKYPSKSISLPNTPNPTNTANIKKTNSYCSMQQVKSPEVYRLPTLPLRCTNLTSEADRLSKVSSLLSRRNMELTPLVIDSEVSCCSTAASPTIITPSPTGAVIGTSYLIDEYYYTKAGTYYTDDPLVSIESSSPTYLSYKKRFRL